MADIDDRILSRELKKGSAELIVLSIVEARPRHGYEISKLIELRSGGEIKFHVASLYPLLYRLEKSWLKGRGVLDRQRETWEKFVRAIASITEVKHA